jgi:hypothetical protein
MRYSEQRDEAIAQLSTALSKSAHLLIKNPFAALCFERDPRCPEVAQENYTLIVTITS